MWIVQNGLIGFMVVCNSRYVFLDDWLKIEHHLFPRVSHIHYPAISKIVKDTCEQFKLRYNYFPTMGEAVYSHFKIMDQLGRNNQELAINN